MMRLRRRVLLAALLAACVRGGFWSKREDPLPDGGARCGSGNVVEAEFVDDDFCDCLDNGADEPHTAACAGATDRAAAPRFTCLNSPTDEPMLLAASRVGDGLCDCCDGSDEAAATAAGSAAACVDNCEAAKAAAAAAARAAAEARAAGLRKKAEYVERGQAALGDVEVRLDAARKRLDAAKEEVKRAEDAAREREAAETAAQDALREVEQTAIEGEIDAVLEAAPREAQLGLLLKLAVSQEDSGVEALLDVIMHKAGLPTEATDKIDDIEVLSQGMEVSEAWAAAAKDAEGEQAEAEVAVDAEGEAGAVSAARGDAIAARAEIAPLLAGLREALHLDALNATGVRVALLTLGDELKASAAVVAELRAALPPGAQVAGSGAVDYSAESEVGIRARARARAFPAVQQPFPRSPRATRAHRRLRACCSHHPHASLRPVFASRTRRPSRRRAPRHTQRATPRARRAMHATRRARRSTSSSLCRRCAATLAPTASGTRCTARVSRRRSSSTTTRSARSRRRSRTS